MIDVEVEVYDRAARAVLAAFPGAYTSSEKEPAPPSFPAVSITEIGNVEASELHDSSNRELGSYVTYEVECFSNRRSGAKAEAKALAQAADAAMRGMGFERTFGQFVQNVTDTAIYRYITRYTAVVGATRNDGSASVYRRQ